MNTIHNQLKTLIWGACILFFTYLMISIVWPYTGWSWDVDFLLTKQHLRYVNYYKVAFYSHIFSSCIVLACGSILFSKWVLQKVPKLHRIAGRTYVTLLLLISAPSGLVMGFHANGGFWVQLSFMFLTPLWWWFTWKGLQTAMQKDFKAHRIWMMRSYALTLSAISLRGYQFLLWQFIYVDPEIQYLLISWMSWLGNWLILEVWLWSQQRKIQRKHPKFILQNG